ncbi:hypothetical protein TrVE_jg3665 [Triparma verrucosa]|nr:hypothetical protein TrVE_jg3665 [Triparma verrucosa]
MFQNPIVKQLWEVRHAPSTEHVPYSSFSTPRPPSLSKQEIVYPFSTNPVLMETYKSPWNEVRFGKILEDLDATAGNIAYSHCVKGGSWPAPLIVTAGVDSIQLSPTLRPPVTSDHVLTGQISWVGSSSMEITMTVKEEGKNDGPWLTAKFTFVARSPSSGSATKIVPLSPSTSSEKILFKNGSDSALRKKELRTNLSPTSSYTSQIDSLSTYLFSKSGPHLKMPSLSSPSQILMSRTSLHNSFIAQPQNRNMSSRIFGGFLMRRAFELAFATSYNFGGSRPKFIEVDDVSFLSPVDVGDLMVFHSRVVYTLKDGGTIKLDGDCPLVMVEVEAWVQDPVKVESEISNRFYFTFSLPESEGCREIVPGDMEEAKRMAQRMVADEEQEENRRKEKGV